MWNIQTTEHPYMKGIKHNTTWMNHENIMLSKRHKMSHTVRSNRYETYRLGKFKETEGRLLPGTGG